MSRLKNPDIPKTRAEKVEARRWAREVVARNLHRHQQKNGDYKTSYSECLDHVSRRADKIDAKRDRES